MAKSVEFDAKFIARITQKLGSLRRRREKVPLPQQRFIPFSLEHIPDKHAVAVEEIVVREGQFVLLWFSYHREEAGESFARVIISPIQRPISTAR